MTRIDWKFVRQMAVVLAVLLVVVVIIAFAVIGIESMGR